MKIKFLFALLAGCLLFLAPLSLCAQEPVCGKCLKKQSNCPYRCNHPTCKTCGKVCGARVDPCPYGGKHPKCNACGKLKENCAYKGKHPTCSSCGRVCGAKNNPCPYGGNHPEPPLSVTGSHAGHDYVDLGLSVKWATCNVGASSPTGYGNYYAWGETSPRSSYDVDNCKTLDCDLDDIGGDASYDAARANWGGSWRLPTLAECDELVNNCNRQWTTQNGVAGMRFTSKKNGNSVFFPAAGSLFGTSTFNAGGCGYYWSSSPCGSNTQIACSLCFGSEGSASSYWRRNDGCSVRPVVE